MGVAKVRNYFIGGDNYVRYWIGLGRHFMSL